MEVTFIKKRIRSFLSDFASFFLITAAIGAAVEFLNKSPINIIFASVIALTMVILELKDKETNHEK